MKFVFLGLSITSSWGNGHATTYRGLIRELSRKGHDVLFLERDVPWYAANRDLASPPYCGLGLYSSLEELRDFYSRDVKEADVVILGSYVPQGVEAGKWVLETAHGLTAFYDIDTPVTVSKLNYADTEYLSPALVPRFDLYLSFTGGPILNLLETRYGARAARVLYCSADPENYSPNGSCPEWDLGYIGTYSADRQPALTRMLIWPAKAWKEGRFIVAGPLYPSEISWPENVRRIEHLPPSEHKGFYNRQRFTLNVTRADMIAAGYSPSVRLFEAAACGTSIISDYWKGIETIFEPGREILIASGPEEVLSFLRNRPETLRHEIALRARERVLREHTAAHRAEALEKYISEVKPRMRTSPP